MSETETDLIPLRDPEPQDADGRGRDPQRATDEQDATDEQGTTDQPQSDGDVEPDPAGGTDLVIATGLDHGSGVRRVFAGLDFRLPAGTLGVLHGTDGSGKSTLLLALIGRATGVHGSLQVAGYDALHGSAKLRSISTAARISSVVDTEPKHSVSDAIQDRAALEGLRTRRARAAFDEVADVLDLHVSDDQLVEELDAYQRATLALALAAVRPSTLMVLDDADRGLSVQDQDRLYATIMQLMSYTGSTMVVSTVEADTIPYDAVPISLPAPGQHRRPLQPSTGRTAQ